ncbi:MAG TPA: hypothetical protein VEZ55_04435 [Chitinophagaceae bacterium]|jgi:hypothetical protein|nr:hypothetical protein [Chitinophagaceae bacterium]
MQKDDTHLNRFYFWVNYLKAISLFFAFLGALWAIIGSFDPFGLYDRAFAQAFWNVDRLPADAQKTFSFILGPFGATNAGYFILQFFIAKHAYSNRQMWGYKAIVVAFLVWLILDTSMCLVHKGYFNILFANIPSLLAMLPIFFTRRYFTDRS